MDSQAGKKGGREAEVPLVWFGAGECAAGRVNGKMREAFLERKGMDDGGREKLMIAPQRHKLKCQQDEQGKAQWRGKWEVNDCTAGHKKEDRQDGPRKEGGQWMKGKRIDHRRLGD